MCDAGHARTYSRLTLMRTYVGPSAHGMGVFAKDHICSGEIIDICPALIYDESQALSPDDHSFEWQEGKWCIVLGNGSLYNHSCKPNAQFVRDFENNLFLFVSLCHINPDDEIRINYNCDIYSNEPQWFETP